MRTRAYRARSTRGVELTSYTQNNSLFFAVEFSFKKNFFLKHAARKMIFFWFRSLLKNKTSKVRAPLISHLMNVVTRV